MSWWEKFENTDSGFSQGLFRPAKRIKLDPDCLITSVALVSESDFVGDPSSGLSSIIEKPCGRANLIKDDFVASNSIFDLAAKSKYETLLKENFPPTRKYPKKRLDGSLNDSFGRKADSSIFESSFNNLFDLSAKKYSKVKMGNIFGKEKEPTPKTAFEQNLEEFRGYANALTPDPHRLVNYDDSVVSIGLEATEELEIDTSFLDDKKVPRKSPKKTIEVQPIPISEDFLDRGLDNTRLLEIQLKRLENERRIKIRNEERERDISETEKWMRKLEEKRLKDSVAAAERDRLSINLEGLILDVPRAKPESFPPLPEDALELVRRAWNKRLPDDEVFADNGVVKIHRKDLLTLSGLDWLNDEIINFYLDLVCKRSKSDPDLPKVYAFQTFFYTTLCQRGYGGVKRWTKKVDVFSYDIWLVPVHLQVHWCMAVVDLQNKTIEYYDSMLGKNSVVFELLTEYLSSESMDKRKQPLNTNDWKLIRKCDIPTQQNGSDCGMFSCKFGEYASRRAEIDFSQKNMPYFRQRMVYEICQQQLM